MSLYKGGNILVPILIMCLGIAWGLTFFKRKYNKYNNIVQTIAIMLTIFCMGVGLGSSPTFVDDLISAGSKSLVYAIIPILFSILLVYPLTSIFLKGGKSNHDGDRRDC